MSRLNIPRRDDVAESTYSTLDNIERTLRFLPNLHRLMASNPHVLTAFVGLQSNLARTLDVKTRDAIALAVSESSGCEYCLAAHSWVASAFAKMSAQEILRNRAGHSEDPKRAAAARFAKRVVESSGKVDDSDLQAVRAAGYDDAEIVAIIALSGQFLLTNFLNNVALTEPDFPQVVDAEAV